MTSNVDTYLLGCGKRRRRSSSVAAAAVAEQRVFRFKSFGEPGYPAEFDGSFYKNVKALLEFGHVERRVSGNGATSCWSFQLEVHRHRPDHRVLLFVVEEPIEASLYCYCKYCEYIGWGQHMICNMKYHFVVPSKDTVAMAASPCFELNGHILHGVFHCNGFGHLLSLNGLNSGSPLSGHQLMDFWDRLCSGLRARKVSLIDVSQKKGMDLRLLHGVAYSGTWFSRWGYQFGRGSFGVTQSMYQKAIQTIQNIPLSVVLHHIGTLDHHIPLILTRYQAYLSNHSLITLGGLFHFILELESRLPKEAFNTLESLNPGILLESSCRWSPKRVEMATRVIVEALKKVEHKWVSRQEVRDAARAYIGDTGLLDFVLKSLGNHVVGNYLVRRSLNPVTKVLEYCIEDISGSVLNHDGFVAKDFKAKAPCKITRGQLVKDVTHLYKYMLKERRQANGVTSTIAVASGIILDSKHLVKEFNQNPLAKMKKGQREPIQIYCTLQLKDMMHQPSSKCNPMLCLPTIPYEHLPVDGSMTIMELKREVEACFKEMYWGFQGLVIESILNLNARDIDIVSGVIENGTELILEGRVNYTNGVQEMCKANITNANERGFIDCPCGAKEDDGERMVACDICEWWQHTRCVRIPNNEEVPRIFICDRCEQDIIFSPSVMM